ncbi:PKD domain-containing protein [Streptomyces sp. NPDC048254]|uniref:PKD domain-containing protein n=1 Tax=Streptomyces sp. NPDC048254 TaxID=3365525 RepID=UPI003723B85A
MWKRIAYTQTGTTGVLYEDGVEAGRNTSVTITPGAIKGWICDFRVYDRALADGEVGQLALPVATQVVTAAFTDRGGSDTHTCTVDWKDGGRPVKGRITGTTCHAEHVYRRPGGHRPVLTVTDDDGGGATVTVPVGPRPHTM